MLKVQRSGDWRKMGRFLEKFEKISEEEKDLLMKSLAVWTLKRMIFHIEKQDLPWKPLTIRYMFQKALDGESLDTYKATGEFEGKLKVVKTREGYQVGAFGMDTHTASGLKMNELARILEYGSPDRGIPARPLLRPTIAELKEFVKTLRMRYVKSLKRRYKES